MFFRQEIHMHDYLNVQKFVRSYFQTSVHPYVQMLRKQYCHKAYHSIFHKYCLHVNHLYDSTTHQPFNKSTNHLVSMYFNQHIFVPSYQHISQSTHHHIKRSAYQLLNLSTVRNYQGLPFIADLLNPNRQSCSRYEQDSFIVASDCICIIAIACKIFICGDLTSNSFPLSSWNVRFVLGLTFFSTYLLMDQIDANKSMAWQGM